MSLLLNTNYSSDEEKYYYHSLEMHQNKVENMSETEENMSEMEENMSETEENMSALWSAGLAVFIYLSCTKLRASSQQKQSEGLGR